MGANNFKIASFNMNGPLNGLPKLSDLLNTMDFIVMQDHWLRECQFNILC